ncbi:SCO1/SenC domain-containing protein, putative [Eimeria acervulina]|uniref:SCO1/SenC domain-containing protein, putative n=1 Tax=Eimeria acervulina TaxID=5801 RepID=U6GQJ8_EIMAC|nr:SCO1/SenC domain-containing protein, putative [Eimeria acervulina]CDI81503.1 SCO1/SenC domain-containing protein, putative [Eimeria acervulina]
MSSSSSRSVLKLQLGLQQAAALHMAVQQGLKSPAAAAFVCWRSSSNSSSRSSRNGSSWCSSRSSRNFSSWYSSSISNSSNCCRVRELQQQRQLLSWRSSSSSSNSRSSSRCFSSRPKHSKGEPQMQQQQDQQQQQQQQQGQTQQQQEHEQPQQRSKQQHQDEQQQQQQPQQQHQEQQQQQQQRDDSAAAPIAHMPMTAAAKAAAAAAAAAARPDLNALRFPSVEAAAARAAHRHEVEAAAAAAAAAAAVAAQTPPKASLPPSSPRLVTWRVSLLCSAACAAMTALVLFQMERKKRQKAAITETLSIGRPLVGGSWVLVNSAAQLCSNKDFKDKYLLLYFGFSFCPDICPKELQKIAEVIEQIDKEFGEVVQPGQIKNITRKFRVYFNETARTGDEEYLVDHSIIHYFMGLDGSLKDFFGQNMTAREIAQKISKHIKEDRIKKEQRRSKPNPKP